MSKAFLELAAGMQLSFLGVESLVGVPVFLALAGALRIQSGLADHVLGAHVLVICLFHVDNVHTTPSVLQKWLRKLELLNRHIFHLYPSISLIFQLRSRQFGELPLMNLIILAYFDSFGH